STSVQRSSTSSRRTVPFTVTEIDVCGAGGAAGRCARSAGAAATAVSAVPLPSRNRRREIVRLPMGPPPWRECADYTDGGPMDIAFLEGLRRIAGDAAVLHDPHDLLTYECDGLAHLRETPAAVVLPASAAEVQAIVKLCARAQVPFVARGHGTGLSGGALPVAGGLVIALSRLNRILHVDIANQRVTVEPGVTNLEITRQVAPFGFYYAPDPSSQQICSIGGNVAENSGGAHCLKYGFTV